MDYMCGHYWTEDSEIALVLKQLVFREGELPVVFACMAGGRERKLFTEGMTEWFHRKAVPCCQKAQRGIKKLERSLEKQAPKHAHNPEMAAVLLCVGEVFFLWGKGSVKITLLNAGFGKAHYRRLLSEEMQERGEALSGSLETGVGLLLTAKDFGAGSSMEELAACLAIKELDKEIKLEKRLKELGEESIRKGKEHGAAVLVVTC